MTESHIRSLVKGITWRITGSLDTFFISWLITGKPAIAISITAVELITKIILYWAHERTWLRIKWGAYANHTDNPADITEPVQKTE